MRRLFIAVKPTNKLKMLWEVLVKGSTLILIDGVTIKAIANYYKDRKAKGDSLIKPERELELIYMLEVMGFYKKK